MLLQTRPHSSRNNAIDNHDNRFLFFLFYFLCLCAMLEHTYMMGYIWLRHVFATTSAAMKPSSLHIYICICILNLLKVFILLLKHCSFRLVKDFIHFFNLVYFYYK